MKPEDSKKYNFIRKIISLFYKVNKNLTNCNFSDPGMSVFYDIKIIFCFIK